VTVARSRLALPGFPTTSVLTTARHPRAAPCYLSPRLANVIYRPAFARNAKWGDRRRAADNNSRSIRARRLGHEARELRERNADIKDENDFGEKGWVTSGTLRSRNPPTQLSSSSTVSGNIVSNEMTFRPIIYLAKRSSRECAENEREWLSRRSL